MNWLDRAISEIFPERGIRRVRARAALRAMRAIEERAYEGARNTRRTDGWRAASTSANAEIGNSLITLRNRSRQQIRDNPYARKAIVALKANTIGTGITARVPKSIQSAWRPWIENCDFDGQHDIFGLENLAAGAAYESGEVLVRRWYVRPQYAGDIGLRLQVLEPDYLDHTKTCVLSTGNFVVAGVEYTKIGQRAAYWLWPSHPGDSILINRHRMESVRVDASDILHIYEKDRPGQTRGVPRLAVALMKARDLDDYEEAELVRKKIEACFVAFVTTSQGNTSSLANVSTEAEANGNTKRLEAFEPAMIEYLRPDEKVEFGAPNVVQGYGDYTRTQLRAIAAGAGVTYEQLTGDLTGVNYSSIRAGLLEFRQMVEQFRWLTFVPMFCRPVFNWFAQSAYDMGRIRSMKYASEVIWTAPSWQWVDPLKEVQAAKEEITGSMRSLSERIRMMGYDPDEVFAEIANDKKRLAELGINFPADPAPASAAAPAEDSEE